MGQKVNPHAVSYTHLDVYKRQAQEDEFDCHIDSGVGQIRFGGKNVGLLDEEYTLSLIHI